MFWKRIIKKLSKKSPLFFFQTTCITHMSFVCHSMHSYVIRMSLVCIRTSFLNHSYVLVCHLYVARIYSYVIRMSLVCTRMSSVCHSYVLVCYLYVTRMYSYVIRMSFARTRMSSVCHSYVLLCHSYVTRIYSYVIRMSLFCGFTMNPLLVQKTLLNWNTVVDFKQRFDIFWWDNIMSVLFFLSWDFLFVLFTAKNSASLKEKTKWMLTFFFIKRILRLNSIFFKGFKMNPNYH